jgi:hypothetical protein
MKMNTENQVVAVGAGGTGWGAGLIAVGGIALSACGGLNATSDISRGIRRRADSTP